LGEQSRSLDNANLKVTGVVTDILGVSGRAMLKAPLGGRQTRSDWRIWRRVSYDLDHIDHSRVTHRLVHRLRNRGYQVELREVA
jgi:hypothetical protein